MTEKEQLIEALEKLNLEYIGLLNSKEFILGSRLFRIKDDLKEHNFSGVFAKIRAHYKKKNFSVNNLQRVNINNVFITEKKENKYNKCKVAVYSWKI